MRRVRAGWFGSAALGLVMCFPLVRCGGEDSSGDDASGGKVTAGETGEAGSGEGGDGARGGSNRGGVSGSSSGTGGTGARGGSGGADGGEDSGGTSGSANGGSTSGSANGGSTSGSANGGEGGQSGCDPTATASRECPSPGACYLVGDGAECREPVGTTSADVICGDPYTCAPGTTCFIRAPSVGACARVCRLDGACVSPMTCTPIPLAGGGETTEYGVCLGCDPTDLSGGGCRAGAACVLYPRDEDASTTICMGSEGLGEGARCGYLYSCGPGYFCVAEPGQVGECRRVCRIGSTCQGGGACADTGAGVWGLCP